MLQKKKKSKTDEKISVADDVGLGETWLDPSGVPGRGADVIYDVSEHVNHRVIYSNLTLEDYSQHRYINMRKQSNNIRTRFIWNLNR